LVWLSIAAGLTLVVVAQSRAQEQAKDASDRSAEPLLRSVFADYGARRNFKIVISTASKMERNGAFYAGSETVVTYAHGMRFRVVASDMWGSALWMSCDGRTLLRDPLTVGAPVELHSAPKSLIEADGRLQPGQAFGSPMFQLLLGPSGFDQAVEPTGPITSRTVGSGWTILSYPSKQVGRTELWMRTDDPQRLVRRIQYDNRAQLERLARDIPDWFTMPEDPLTRQEISYLSVTPAMLEEACTAIPAPGLPVQDFRPRTSAGPVLGTPGTWLRLLVLEWKSRVPDR